MSAQLYLEVGGDAAPAGYEQAAALRDCLAANYARLHRRLLRHFGCPDRASDCLHDAWLRLGEMTAPATVQCPEAYVYRVACNLALDSLRGNRQASAFGDFSEEWECIADPLPGPELVAEARSDLAVVEQAIQRLPRRHRDILMELRINESTRLEVAVLHGLSLRRIDTILHQALDFCAQHTGRQVLAGVRGRRRMLPRMEMCA